MKIEIAKQARRQAERASNWWRENRLYTPGLFDAELERALQLLLVMPNAGVSYATARRPGLRRLLLPKTEYHLYFAVERASAVAQGSAAEGSLHEHLQDQEYTRCRGGMLAHTGIFCVGGLLEGRSGFSARKVPR